MSEIKWEFTPEKQAILHSMNYLLGGEPWVHWKRKGLSAFTTQALCVGGSRRPLRVHMLRDSTERQEGTGRQRGTDRVTQKEEELERFKAKEKQREETRGQEGKNEVGVGGEPNVRAEGAG